MKPSTWSARGFHRGPPRGPVQIVHVPLRPERKK